jgi:hypothetical protein
MEEREGSRIYHYLRHRHEIIRHKASVAYYSKDIVYFLSLLVMV